jgi:hypothetical protein
MAATNHTGLSQSSAKRSASFCEQKEAKKLFFKLDRAGSHAAGLKEQKTAFFQKSGCFLFRPKPITL